MAQRTPADIQADLDELTARFNAAVNALKMTPKYDPQREEWQHTVATYNGMKANLIAELHKSNRRVLR